MVRHLVMALATTVLACGTAGAHCGDCGEGHGADAAVAANCGGGCGVCYQRQMYTETRMRTVTRYRQEERERTYTVCRRVPRVESRTQTYTVMVPETRSREETYTVCKPEQRSRTENYTVMVSVPQ
ncbi:MAG: hypothetical protein AAGF97_09730, partial [Planctomycetota bacterium]